MEFRQVVRSRRMIREFADRPVPLATLDRILATALHAPSAGFAQGLELVVLDEPESVEAFFRLTDPRKRKHRNGPLPPVIVLPVADRDAYLRRYSEPDKQGLGLDVEEGWPIAYWELDAAMAVMLLLLAAVDEGLGGWFFGIFQGEQDVARWLRIPSGCRPVGAVALGYAAAGASARGSATTRPRRSLQDVVHRGGWAHGE